MREGQHAWSCFGDLESSSARGVARMGGLGLVLGHLIVHLLQHQPSPALQHTLMHRKLTRQTVLRSGCLSPTMITQSHTSQKLMYLHSRKPGKFGNANPTKKQRWSVCTSHKDTGHSRA